MTWSQRTALVYGASFLGAWAFARYRGRALPDTLTDTILHGVVIGTGLNAGLWVLLDSGWVELPALTARPNATKEQIEHGMGSLTPRAVEYLAQINADDLFRPLEQDGWVIGDVPANEYLVEQR